MDAVSYHNLTSDRIKWLWIETSETHDPKSDFIPIKLFSQVFYSINGKMSNPLYLFT